jgi:two-component system, NtrC family, response regulator AtoC
MRRALIVDDHEATASALAALVRGEDFEVAVATNLGAARAHLAAEPVDVVLLDLKLPDGQGLSLLDAVEATSTAPSVVLMTGEASLDSAVEALRRGVTDYLTKPIDLKRLRSILQEVAQTSGLAREIGDLRAQSATSQKFGHIIGASAPMRAMFDLLARIAPSSASVLITGDSGTGKEVVARTIHDLSRRRHGPFVAINCGAISPTLMESELFGHERGAFTGAERRHAGLFERATKGTLFLDEITEMALDLQVKLLRVLETGVVRRVGSETTIDVDVRILAATNRSPDEAVQKGKLREDLYYRLKVFQVYMPPLRDRTDDIPPLVDHFLAQLAEKEGETKTMTAEAMEKLRAYAWPGNVRELRNAVHSGFVLADGTITLQCLPPEVVSGSPVSYDGETITVRVGMTLAEAEKRLVLATLAHLGGNKTRTAEVLGISLKTPYARLAEYKEVTETDPAPST